MELKNLESRETDILCVQGFIWPNCITLCIELFLLQKNLFLVPCTCPRWTKESATLVHKVFFKHLALSILQFSYQSLCLKDTLANITGILVHVRHPEVMVHKLFRCIFVLLGFPGVSSVQWKNRIVGIIWFLFVFYHGYVTCLFTFSLVQN